MTQLTVEREERGWSRAELARRSGLNAVTVGLIEAGRLVPYDSQLRKLATAFDLPADNAAALLRPVVMTTRTALRSRRGA